MNRSGEWACPWAAYFYSGNVKLKPLPDGPTHGVRFICCFCLRDLVPGKNPSYVLKQHYGCCKERRRGVTSFAASWGPNDWRPKAFPKAHAFGLASLASEATQPPSTQPPSTGATGTQGPSPSSSPSPPSLTSTSPQLPCPEPPAPSPSLPSPSSLSPLPPHPVPPSQPPSTSSLSPTLAPLSTVAMHYSHGVICTQLRV